MIVSGDRFRSMVGVRTRIGSRWGWPFQGVTLRSQSSHFSSHALQEGGKSPVLTQLLMLRASDVDTSASNLQCVPTIVCFLHKLGQPVDECMDRFAHFRVGTGARLRDDAILEFSQSKCLVPI